MPPSSMYFPGYSVPLSCSSSKYGTSCTGGYYVPGYTMYFPEEYQLDLCSDMIGHQTRKTSCGWRDVAPSDYTTFRIGEWYSVDPKFAVPSDTKVTKS